MALDEQQTIKSLHAILCSLGNHEYRYPLESTAYAQWYKGVSNPIHRRVCIYCGMWEHLALDERVAGGDKKCES